ncbi:MAG: YraN family protein [Actinobacteria bacterium]|nr:MAG: YraN family protein [Actinomycetota bacterium]
MESRPGPSVGARGEEAALAHYRDHGYRLVARNWRCSLGELDLVLTRGSVLVFCEVKARSGRAYGEPFEAVTWKKQRKLRALALAFLAVSGRTADSIRFDVASVTAGPGRRTSVFVFESAF